ncbi:uncharacterized protein PHACADRAFT_109059, partial [Phanerochaete carnosa HHB-10118-sp]
IAGGGAVGIELAGEIREAHPNTKVTIVHSETRLLSDVYPEKLRKNLEQKVLAQGITLIDQDYIDVFPDPLFVTDVVTRKGKTIKDADLVIQAFGSRPNTDVINTLGAGVLTEAGHVKVKPTLELPDHPGVFAAGDIIDWHEQKQALKSGSHMSVVVPNLLSFLRGQSQKKVYKGSTEMIVVPIGRLHGSGYFGVLWGVILGDWFASMIKGKDLLVDMSRKSLNY